MKGKFSNEYLICSFTVEMAVIVPVILMIMYFTVMTTFYEYDKNIINAAAYETAVVGSTKVRQKETIDCAQLKILFREKTDGKCLLIKKPDVQIYVTDREIKVLGSGKYRSMKIIVEQKAVITKPEKMIRKKRR